MKQTLEILKLLATLIPTIVTLIKAVEEALPEKGQGAEKLALVRGLIEQAYNSVSAAAIPFADLWPHIERAIAGFVSLFNKVGAFRK